MGVPYQPYHYFLSINLFHCIVNLLYLLYNLMHILHLFGCFGLKEMLRNLLRVIIVLRNRGELGEMLW